MNCQLTAARFYMYEFILTAAGDAIVGLMPTMHGRLVVCVCVSARAAIELVLISARSLLAVCVERADGKIVLRRLIGRSSGGSTHGGATEIEIVEKQK